MHQIIQYRNKFVDLKLFNMKRCATGIFAPIELITIFIHHVGNKNK